MEFKVTITHRNITDEELLADVKNVCIKYNLLTISQDLLRIIILTPQYKNLTIDLRYLIYANYDHLNLL